MPDTEVDLVAEVKRLRAALAEMQQRCDDLQAAYDALVLRSPSRVLAGLSDSDADHQAPEDRYLTSQDRGTTIDARTMAQMREDSDLGQIDAELHRRGVIR